MKPALIVVAGPNDAGKTTITEKLLRHEWMDGCVYINPSINAQRVAMRVMKGGHDVPIQKIIDRYYRSIAHCLEAVPIVDRAYFYDNSETDCDPILLLKIINGNMAKVYNELTPWAQDIAKQISAQNRAFRCQFVE